MRTALTVAGSDSVGGAGIQADIKAMASLGVHAATVITAVTAQNTCKVSGIYPMSAEAVKAQLDAVLSDCDIKAVKTGMLYSAEIIETVADTLEDHEVPLIVDPVMVATVGDRLYDKTYVRALKEKLLPICELVTPNRHEAEVLADMRIDNEDDVTYACELIGKQGSSVLLKGGHMATKTVTDYLYLSSGITRIRNPRIQEAGHGSGCTLSAFITANMANGLDLVTSVLESRKMIQKSIATQYSVGEGVPVVNPQITLIKKENSDAVDHIRALDKGVEDLIAKIPVELVPREGLNFVYSKDNPHGPEDIAGIDRRMFVHNGMVKKGGPVKYGAGEHLSYILLEAMKSDKDVRSMVTFRSTKDIVEDMRAAKLRLVYARRCDQSHISAAFREIFEDCDAFPDAIVESGNKGTVINLFGKNPADVVSKLARFV
ncbi:MAG: bifunctional hydroxymethylpyrimidine kinase/phosphomethylpyrimidine kinase [archaeon]|nr:bifunctional hydroxymethylpyrimidine kinase/phosphomethylpyrimidine kinase [archaeon]